MESLFMGLWGGGAALWQLLTFLLCAATMGQPLSMVRGPAGAGKTTLVRQLLASWNVEEEGASPTFGLVHHHVVYRGGDVHEVRHMDLYRLENEEEAERSGIAEMLNDGALNLVEWPERIPGLMPDGAWLIEMKVEADDSRTCILSQLRG